MTYYCPICEHEIDFKEDFHADSDGFQCKSCGHLIDEVDLLMEDEV